LARSSTRVLVVDDNQPWCRFIRSTLQLHPELELVGEAADGLEAVHKTQELQPDLILLDIGLPKLSGDHSPDIAIAALRSGASGYIVKSDAGRELATALEAVLEGKQFVSSSVEGFDFLETSETRVSEADSLTTFEPKVPSSFGERGHVVQFYTDDEYLIAGLGTLFRNALSAGESVLAVMTKSHRTSLRKWLMMQGIDESEAKRTGRLILLDAVEALSGFMDASGPNRERFLLQFGDTIRRSEAAAVAKSRRVVAFGEIVAVLGEQKRYDAVIRLEQLWNELALTHPLYLCCAYPANLFQEQPKGEPYASICAEHSDVVSV
jgi:hypothetical protein